MVKVVVGTFGKRGRRLRDTAVTQKRVRDAASGRFVTMRTIDAQSETLSEDLNYVFARNVAEARRENKLVTGVADRAPGKP